MAKTEFKVWLCLLVDLPGGKFRVFRKKVKLPFVPTVGLALELDSKTEFGFSFRFDASLAYDLAEDSFSAVDQGVLDDVDLYLAEGFIEQELPKNSTKALKRKK